VDHRTATAPHPVAENSSGSAGSENRIKRGGGGDKALSRNDCTHSTVRPRQPPSLWIAPPARPLASPPLRRPAVRRRGRYTTTIMIHCTALGRRRPRSPIIGELVIRNPWFSKGWQMVRRATAEGTSRTTRRRRASLPW